MSSLVLGFQEIEKTQLFLVGGKGLKFRGIIEDSWNTSARRILCYDRGLSKSSRAKRKPSTYCWIN